MTMNTSERHSLLLILDEELLKGGVVLSEWCSFIVREADIAFVGGADLATIITTVAGIETYLRSAYAEGNQGRLVDLIDNSPISDDLKIDLHKLRKYRNSWVHVDDAHSDISLNKNAGNVETELEFMALFAVRVLRRTIYSDQWI